MTYRVCFDIENHPGSLIGQNLVEPLLGRIELHPPHIGDEGPAGDSTQVPEQAGEEDDPHPQRYGGSLVLDQKDPHLDEPGLSSGESAALWAGVSLLLLLLTCGLWNVCGSCRTRITCRMQSFSGARRSQVLII